MIAAVVYVVPLSVPPQPETLAMLLPFAGFTLKVVVPPGVTDLELGLIVPLPMPVTVVLTM